MRFLSHRQEQELLLCCARTRADAAMRERIHTLLQTAIDWEYVLDLAATHGVAPVVCRTLDMVAPNAMPSAIRARIDLRLQASAMQSRFLSEQLAAIAQIMHAEALPALYFKGPLLATAIYGDLSLREFHDLDMLVPAGVFRRASDVLQAHGYSLRADHGWQAMFVRGPVCIDLHRAISAPAYPVALDFERWWNRRELIEIAGMSVPTLCREDLLVLLSIQAARDTWGWTLHLQKICDIAETAIASPGLDWLAVEAEARSLHVQWILAFGLHLAVRILGVELPEAAARSAVASRSVRFLVDQECEGFFEAPENRGARLRGAEFHARVRERVRDRISPYWFGRRRLQWVPNANDRALVSLPRWLAPLYYVMRPFRLLWRHGGPSILARLHARSPRLNKP
jgi:hypothetical protein